MEKKPRFRSGAFSFVADPPPGRILRRAEKTPSCRALHANGGSSPPHRLGDLTSGLLGSHVRVELSHLGGWNGRRDAVSASLPRINSPYAPTARDRLSAITYAA